MHSDKQYQRNMHRDQIHYDWEGNAKKSLNILIEPVYELGKTLYFIPFLYFLAHLSTLPFPILIKIFLLLDAHMHEFGH